VLNEICVIKQLRITQRDDLTQKVTYSATYTIKKRCIFLTHSVYMFPINLTIITDYFPKQYEPIDLYKGGGFLSLWGGENIFMISIHLCQPEKNIYSFQEDLALK